MDARINELENSIREWFEILNKEGMWLFLATLGCWSVPEGQSRYIALLITFGLLIWRCYARVQDSRSFLLMFSQMQGEIESLTDAPRRGQLLDRLLNLEKRYFTTRGKKYLLPYLSGTLFWVISIIYLFNKSQGISIS